MDNSTHNMSEKLVQYLDGELAGEEKESLEQQLAGDEKLNDELESLKLTREAIKIYGLQQNVSGIHKQMMQELETPVRKISGARRVLRYSMAVAAGVILIAAGIWGYNFYNLSANKVFASNYKSFELGTVRGDDSMQIPQLEKAYRDKDYKKVVVLNSDNRNSSVKETFLAAMASVELKDNTKAIEGFKKVITANETAKTNLFKDEAEYYLALTYIRDKDYDFALDLLRSIQDNPDHIYKKNVTAKLIRQVKMLKWR